jgi:hypothetical protein
VVLGSRLMQRGGFMGGACRYTRATSRDILASTRRHNSAGRSSVATSLVLCRYTSLRPTHRARSHDARSTTSLRAP